MIHHPERLFGVDPALVSVVSLVGQRRDIIVMQGARSLADEEKAIASGHSALKDPMSSLHVVDPVKRPLALAVDVTPSPLDWSDIPAFAALNQDMQAAAAEIGVTLEWGGDWHSLKDYDHWQRAA